MTLEKYIKKLNKIIEKNPEAKDFVVIYGEGIRFNNFKEVHFSPSIGEIKDKNFTNVEEDIQEKNAVCIN